MNMFNSIMEQKLIATKTTDYVNLVLLQHICIIGFLKLAQAFEKLAIENFTFCHIFVSKIFAEAVNLRHGKFEIMCFAHNYALRVLMRHV